MTVSIEDVIAAAERIEGVAVKTPLVTSLYLNQIFGAEVFFKAENLQHMGAFKFRGAYNRLSQLSIEERRNGVVAFSSGNHAQGIAYAAKLLAMPATIVMPHDAPEIKKEGTKTQGATIRFYDRHNESREEIAAAIAGRSGAVVVPAYDDVDIIAGQGSCGLELIYQLQSINVEPDYVLSPCGGGGLMSGVATAVKALSPKTQLIGVEPQGFDDHVLSRKVGERVKIDNTATTLCDSLMAPTPGEITWSINSRLVDEFLAVTELEVMHALSFAFKYLKLVVEPGGVVALAALLQKKIDIKNKRVAVILSGGNVDPATFTRCLQEYPNP
ncbi:MAG: threonine dehydratase [Pseudohongiellaceae bacterium]|jgi:threonine dehydratase